MRHRLDARLKIPCAAAIYAAAWLVVPAIADAGETVVSLSANETIQGAKDPVRPVLHARCVAKRTHVDVAWHTYLGLDNETDVLHQLDGAPAITTTWLVSGDREGTVFPGDAAQFLKSLANHATLHLKVTPTFNASPAVVSFDLEGFADVLRPLREACGW